MNRIQALIIGFFIFLFNHHLDSSFTPERRDYNSYGLKIAMNKILFVEVHNVHNPPTFFVQFAPYNSTQKPLQCIISINELADHYIYSVAVNEVDSEFYFAGELINGTEKTFVGVIKMNYPNLSRNTNENEYACNFSHSIQYLDKYEHQEHYTIAVQPNDTYVYGFSNNFILVFNSKDISFLKSRKNELPWPNKSFMPHAVHLTNNFGIIAGFIANDPDARVKYLPVIYLINFDPSTHHPIVVHYFIPSATPDTWQDLLTNADANIYSAKYDMSVSINRYGSILVGMPYINRVFLFSVDPSDPTNLTYVSRFTNGRCLGYGKSVVWLDNGNMAAVLANIYSFDYDWESSQIFIYDMKSEVYNSSTLLNADGNVIIFVPTPAGTFPSIQRTGSTPLITSTQPCLPGTYKNRTGIHDCILCSTDKKNSGDSNTQCISCSNSSFCPLGSSNETSGSVLDQTVSSFPYPKSSGARSFDDVLIVNIFGIPPNNWKFPQTMLFTIIFGLSSLLLVVFIMTIFKHNRSDPQIARRRETMKIILTKIDFIGGGKSWLGGSLSSTLVTVIICTSIFAYDFYNLYPIENRSDLYFASDSNLVNAVFESSVKSLGLPESSEEKNILDLLDEQCLTLNIDFVNTLIKCDAVELQGLFGITWTTLRWLNCTNFNSILSISILLPHQDISVKVLLADVKTIGGLRIGLYGDGHINGSHTLQQLYFRKSFYKNGYTLGKNIPLSITLTKVVNETVSKAGGASIFGSIFIPVCEADINNILLSNKQYIFSTSPLTSLQISVRKSPYYEKNLQEPMASLSQIIFQVILFFIVCLELLNLIFTLYTLIWRPAFYYLKNKIPKCRRQLSSECITNEAYDNSQVDGVHQTVSNDVSSICIQQTNINLDNDSEISHQQSFSDEARVESTLGGESDV